MWHRQELYSRPNRRELEMMNGILQEARFGFRQWRRRPVATLAVVLVLALGIGANIAMFSGFEAWILRPLDFTQPQQLVALHSAQPLMGEGRSGTSPADYDDWLRQQTSFQEMGAFYRRKFNFNDQSDPVRLDGARVSASLFPLLGKQPVQGRLFSSDEDLAGAPARVAIISHRLWRERFHQAPSVVDGVIRLDGLPHQVVGVMPEGFRFPEWGDIWTPLGLDPEVTPRGNRYLSVIGRLKPGVEPSQAGAELDSIAGRLAAQYPDSNRGWTVKVSPLKDFWLPEAVKVALTASLISVLLVLLVICANIASLMLAQATARSRETAIRSALGAGRLRLARQNLVEGLLMALPGGLLGALMGWLGVDWTLSYIPVDPPYLFRMGFSPEAGLYTFLISLLAGLVCGLAPVIRQAGLNTIEALKSGGQRSAGSTASRRLRGLLVGGELALSAALLIGALLMVKSFVAMQSAERGYDSAGLMTAELSLDNDDLKTGEQRHAAIQRLRAQLQSVPGVRSAAVVSDLPVSQNYRVWAVEAEGSSPQEGDEVRATAQSAAGGYIATMGIPLLAGRSFSDEEIRQGHAVAMVSATLARRLWGGLDVTGRRLRDTQQGDWLRVVGVVGDVDYGRDMTVSGMVPDSQLYVPYARMPDRSVDVVVRAEGERRRLASDLRQAFGSAAPGVPVSEILTMDQAIFRNRWVSSFFSRQLLIYALFATLIAGLGLYGLTADSVASRAKEMAIRLALGARRSNLLKLVMGQALRLGAAGVAAGLVMGLLLAGSTAPMLPGANPQDPQVFLGVALLLLTITLLASLMPARRALKTDPIRALRSE
ncbi:MAG TPA: ABC transporter permease [Acidobacteriota bacterium]|nr:ABC transporter permease [Acidobacteriota bacterium]